MAHNQRWNPWERQPQGTFQRLETAEWGDDPAEFRPAAPQSIAMAILQMIDGTLVGILSCDEECDVTTIGRGRDAMIRLHDPYVSRLHAAIHWDASEGTHVLSDRGGQNGTYLNGRRITAPARVVDGARIRLGATELLYIRRAE